MSWKAYAVAMLVFNIIRGLVLLVIELTQQRRCARRLSGNGAVTLRPLR
jgi:K+-transporting ATPase A subunit